MSPEPPSGKQYEIRYAAQRAVVVEVGGGIREYEINGHAIIDGYAVDTMPDGGRGQPLLPWPNRLADGHYTFGSQSLQLPIDEVAKNNATHGLTRWLNWNLAEHGPDHVTLELLLHPRPGYPFTLQVRITYALTDAGLTVRTRATNVGRETLPFGAGQHPYFTVGTPLIDDATLRIPASKRIELDDQRRLPTGRVLDVSDTEYDFRVPKTVGHLQIDDCFSQLARDEDGRARIVLSGRHTMGIWLDQQYRYVQVFTGDTLVSDRRRRGIAIEPMTCPPNAFKSNTDLIVLPPDGAVELEWGTEPNFSTF